MLFSQMVLIGHAASYFGLMKFIGPPHFPWIQSIAVVGFFWLSGFLICHSVLMRKQMMEDYKFSDFFFSRFARIYSGYVPALALVFLVDFIFVYMYPLKYGFYYSFSIDVALKNMLMLQKFPLNSLSAPMFGSASTWWTLGIEWWLYMFFGLIFIRKASWTKNKIYWVSLLFVSIVPLHYLFKGNGNVGIGLTIVWFLACGIAIFKDMVCVYMPRNFMLIGSVLLAALAFSRYKTSMDSYDLIASIHLGGAILLSTSWMQGVNIKINQSFKKFIHFTAGYSFTLFLTHYSILYFIKTAELLYGWNAFVVSFLVSNIIAALVGYLTEMRYRDFAIYLKRHWNTLVMKDYKISWLWKIK